MDVATLSGTRGCPTVRPSDRRCACLRARAAARPPARLPACPPARLPACPPARLPACPPARLPACPPARLPAHISHIIHSPIPCHSQHLTTARPPPTPSLPTGDSWQKTSVLYCLWLIAGCRLSLSVGWVKPLLELLTGLYILAIGTRSAFFSTKAVELKCQNLIIIVRKYAKWNILRHFAKRSAQYSVCKDKK